MVRAAVAPSLERWEECHWDLGARVDSAVLTHDTSAFVEQIAVTVDDKQVDKHRRRAAKAEVEVLQAVLEVRVLEETLKAMERELVELGDPPRPPSRIRFSREPDRVAARDVERFSARLDKKRKKLAATKARAKTLDEQARGALASSARLTVKTYRLHSHLHHVDCSEQQFVRMSTSQRATPVLVSTTNGVHWWWYRDRFWWEDERLAPDDIQALVDEKDSDDRRQSELRERARAAAFRTPPRGPGR